MPLSPRLRRWLPVLIVNLATLAAIEALSAGAIRLWFSKAEASQAVDERVEQPFDVPLGWVMKSNATIGIDKTSIRTDAHGRAIVPDPLPHPRYTVVVTGGSAMFGVGVTNNALTVPARLQAHLRQDHGLEVNVVNLAARGYVSVQEMLALNLYLTAQPADLVIAVSGHNDATRFLTGQSTPSLVLGNRTSTVEQVNQVERGDLFVANIGPALRQLSHTGNLAAYLMERLQARRKKTAEAARMADAPPDQPTPAFLADHLSNYAMMQAACAARQIDFKVFLQPDAFTKARPSEWEAKRVLEKEGDGSVQRAETTRRARLRYRSAFSALTKPFPFTDLAPVFGDDPDTLYRDACHYNEPGADRLARALAADLAPRLRALPR